jgi:hypothetical protein
LAVRAGRFALAQRAANRAHRACAKTDIGAIADECQRESNAERGQRNRTRPRIGFAAQITEEETIHEARTDQRDHGERERAEHAQDMPLDWPFGQVDLRAGLYGFSGGGFCRRLRCHALPCNETPERDSAKGQM